MYISGDYISNAAGIRYLETELSEEPRFSCLRHAAQDVLILQLVCIQL